MRAAPLRCLLRLQLWIWFCAYSEEGTACTSLTASQSAARTFTGPTRRERATASTEADPQLWRQQRRFGGEHETPGIERGPQGLTCSGSGLAQPS